MEPIRINTGLVKPALDVSRYQTAPKGHTEKGRKPINSREEVLDLVAKATNTKIPRWCRYGENELKRALVRLSEASNVRNKAAYFQFLLKNP